MEDNTGNEARNLKIGDAGVLHRCSSMYGNELLSDVCFVFGPQDTCQVKITAHKFILVTASQAFYAMLCGPLAEKGEIKIPDIEPDVFRTMLKYLYTDEFDVDPKFLPALMYCAKKYLLTRLSQKCLPLLKSSLTEQNALSILEECVLVKEEDGANECLKKINRVTSVVLTSDVFPVISHETLKLILSQEILSAPELEIFEAAWRWAKAECQRRNLDMTGENCRECLGDALFLIRFPAMSMREFANIPAKSGLLTTEETRDVLLFFAADSKPELRFPEKRRLGAEWKTCNLFTVNSSKANNLLHFSSEHIHFRVNEPIYVGGLEIFFRPDNLIGTVSFECTLKNSQQQVLQVINESHNWITTRSETLRVLFTEPVLITTNIFYTLSVYSKRQLHLTVSNGGRNNVTVDSTTFNLKRDLGASYILSLYGERTSELVSHQLFERINNLEKGVISAILFN